MKNFNWGKALIIYFILFIGLLGWIVYKSMQMDHALVADDYYALDLAYQEHYDMSTNQKKYYPDARIIYDATTMQIRIDMGTASKGIIKGNLVMYRASDKEKDRQIAFTIDEGQNSANIPVRDLIMGKWSVQLNWMAQGRSYYLDDTIYVPTP